MNIALKDELKVRMAELVWRYVDSVMGELLDECSKLTDVRGDYDLPMPGYHNAFLWTGLSEEVAVALEELLREFIIIPIPAFSTIDFLIAAQSSRPVPGLPIATELPKCGFAVPHWLPVRFERPDPMMSVKLFEMIEAEREWRESAECQDCYD